MLLSQQGLPDANQTPSFLALLDCVSRANAVARASGVRPSVKRVFSETVN